MSKIICDWTTYKGTHCKKIITHDLKSHDLKFCDLHRDLILEYSRIKEDELCETFKEIKITPRSHKHIKSVMAGLNNDDDNVQVYLAGGSIEEADITNLDYILLDSDNSKFYYNPKRGQRRSKDLKIILREFCQNNSIIKCNNSKYCEECYKKNIKDAPRISCIY